eukprot:CAMPEP_0184400110 /NCGR_PEP_ID=MMETSP0007-20130409/73295_1 /TAXON_ID=97485 /ORGANISM="Prymnesium parvum, Strain Texoma1" /LENGTH=67 /DNA_ID=CAMNT_0026754855 /DNA_START=77 /DNA_END=277 /DNA_ORIENTATION=-
MSFSTPRRGHDMTSSRRVGPLASLASNQSRNASFLSSSSCTSGGCCRACWDARSGGSVAVSGIRETD